jgi:hypothetical protein
MGVSLAPALTESGQRCRLDSFKLEVSAKEIFRNEKPGIKPGFSAD